MFMMVMYPATEGSRFDEVYYVQRHLPLIRDVWGDAVEDIQVLHGKGIGGGSPAFWLFSIIHFRSEAAAMQALSTSRGRELAADVAVFTDVTPIAQFGIPLQGQA